MIRDKQVVLRLVFLWITSAWSQNACRTPNQREGRCIPYSQCRSFSSYFSTDRILTDEELNFLRLSQCGTGPSQVCCPDRVTSTGTPTNSGSAATTTTTTTTTTTSSPPVTRTSLLPDPKNFECGLDFLADRIYGGSNTTLEEFPWYALLNYRTKKGPLEFKCGGSLISQRYVLTAAHCLDNAILDDGEIFVNIRLGEHNTETDEDCEGQDENRFCSDPPQDIGFEEIVLHPGYSKNHPSQHNDVALIRLARDAVLNPFVSPICLPDADFSPTQPGLNVTITGFGHTGTRRHSAVKKKALIPVVDQQRCGSKWTSIVLNEGQLCAGGLFNVDSCHGDSGGPLMRQKLYWTIEGIVSFGNRCGLEDWPGVYTRVSNYVEWIRSVIRP